MNQKKIDVGCLERFQNRVDLEEGVVVAHRCSRDETSITNLQDEGGGRGKEGGVRHVVLFTLFCQVLLCARLTYF